MFCAFVSRPPSVDWLIRGEVLRQPHALTWALGDVLRSGAGRFCSLASLSGPIAFGQTRLVGVGVGALKTLFVFAWDVCWIIIPYASASGKAPLKFRFGVFSVGSRTLNIMYQCQMS